MIRLHGRAATGKRLRCPAPFGHWKTNTFIAGLRHDQLTAPFIVDGAMNGDMFVEYIRQELAPTLSPGDYVIMDNLASHKVKGVKEAIEEKGAILLYLPPYSPEFNPIEQFFAKLKALLRKAAARTIDKLEAAIVDIIDALKKIECHNFFLNSGY
jgi:transposase